MAGSPRWISAFLAIAGASTVVTGFWLPWLIVEPGYDGAVPSIYIYGMESGIRPSDWLILAVVGVALIVATRYRSRPVGNMLVFGSGMMVLLYALTWALGTTGLDGSHLGVFVVGPGLFLSILGGLLLAGAGLVRLVSPDRFGPLS